MLSRYSDSKEWEKSKTEIWERKHNVQESRRISGSGRRSCDPGSRQTARRLPQGRPHDALYREVYGLPCGGYDQVKRRENREVVAVNVLKSIVIILWAITGTINLIQGNIDRWEYLMVWLSLMIALIIWG